MSISKNFTHDPLVINTVPPAKQFERLKDYQLQEPIAFYSDEDQAKTVSPSDSG